MKADIAKKWVEALRSGKYQQTKEYLKTYEVASFGNRQIAYCCLGVLVEAVLGQEIKLSERVLGSEARVASGITSREGALTLNNSVTCLSALNDGGKTFIEIADVIEKHWKEL